MSMTFAPGGGVGPVTLVSCLQDRMDAFMVGLDGQVYTSSWWPGSTSWSIWRPITGLTVAACARVTAISPVPGAIEIFAVGRDGFIYWARSIVGTATTINTWGNWYPTDKTFRTVLHAHICALSDTSGHVFLFAADHRGRVYENLWTGASWSGWIPLSAYETPGVIAPITPPGAPLGATWTATGNVALFVVTSDTYIVRCIWKPSVTDASLPPVDKWDNMPWDLPICPRTPISATLHWTGAICIFFVYAARNLKTWEFSDSGVIVQGWYLNGRWTWSVFYDFVSPRKAHITVAVQPGSTQFNLFTVSYYGNTVYHATSAIGSPGSVKCGPTSVGNFVADPSVPVGVVRRSNGHYDIAAAQPSDGKTLCASWSSSGAEWYALTWSWMGQGITGMADPLVSQLTPLPDIWVEPGSYWSNEAQGMTTDGDSWYLTSNGEAGVRAYSGDIGNKVILGEVYVPFMAFETSDLQWASAPPHLGASDCFAGMLYVPLQDPNGDIGFGVWKMRTDFEQATREGRFVAYDVFELDEPVTGAHFAWCAVNPLNGRLYSATANGSLFVAFDKDFMTRCREDDIHLSWVPQDAKWFQGAAFTCGGRLLVVKGPPNADGWLYCYSSVTARLLGYNDLGTFGHKGTWEGSETEGITVRAYGAGYVHVLEIDNRDPWNDYAYLHTYGVPNGNIL